MAVGLMNSHHAAEEEARAEVDVLNSRLEKTSQLTKKIEACLGRLEATGKNVRDVVTPLNGETKKLQVMGSNIDAVLAAIERLRQPADSKTDEEQIIRLGPQQAGLQTYLGSLKRLTKALSGMRASNLRSTQQTMGDLQRMVGSGNSQLEAYFDKIIRAETPRSVEPLHYITRKKAFPTLPRDQSKQLAAISTYLQEGAVPQQETGAATTYAEVRGPYLATTLANLAAASINTARKKSADAVYRTGTSGIGHYVEALEGLIRAEYENIRYIFTNDEQGGVLQATCQASLTELSRTLRELNNHVKAHVSTDCFLAYEILEVISNFANSLEQKASELKPALAASLRPVRETAKSSLPELLEDTRRRVSNLQTLPSDGAPIPIVSETMQRLQGMVEFLHPIESIMVSLGDGGWKASSTSSRGGGGGGGGDTAPSLSSFEIGADGKQIFARYCADTIDALLSSLDTRAKTLLGRKSTMGVLLANSVTIIERMIRDSDLSPLLDGGRIPIIDQWRKKATSLYTDTTKDVSMHLFDVIHTGGRTGGGGRPQSNQGGVDSASIMKGMSSKDKDAIKNKFQAFNASFDDMVLKHKGYSMEREVKQMFASDVQRMLEPLYGRFWDRYHEVDKGRGKYVKYDKPAIGAVFASLY